MSTSEDNASDERDSDDREQPLIEHLTELRNRLLRSMVVLGVIFLALFPFSDSLYATIARPLIEALPIESSMIATEVASPFLVPFKLCIYLSIFIGMPYLLYQAWAFVAPALYRNEKSFAFPLLVSSIVLFYCGILFAFFAVFPLLFSFFSSVTPAGVTMMTDINHYLDFILKLFFAFGIAFEVPIATILLVSTGITTIDALSAKRPYFILGAFVAGMLLTPPDIVSQFLLAIPVWLLFEAGLVFSRMFARPPEDADEEEDEDGDRD